MQFFCYGRMNNSERLDQGQIDRSKKPCIFKLYLWRWDDIILSKATFIPSRVTLALAKFSLMMNFSRGEAWPISNLITRSKQINWRWQSKTLSELRCALLRIATHLIKSTYANGNKDDPLVAPRKRHMNLPVPPFPQ